MEAKAYLRGEEKETFSVANPGCTRGSTRGPGEKVPGF